MQPSDIENLGRKLLAFFEITEPSIEVSEEDGQIHVNIDPQVPNPFSRDMRKLLAFEQVLRILVHKEISEELRVTVDIGGLKTESEDRLRSEVLRAIDYVKATGHAKYLRPMSPYERRLVHTWLSEYPELGTESVGVDPRRRVVIKLTNGS